MSDIAIKIENLKKKYKLGAIGGATLNAELQSWWARKCGKEDPNLKIGQDYSKDGESFWALDGIDLELKQGEALGLIGANGAGKSTLLKILSRVTAPTEGDIWINGRITSMLEVGTGFHGELTGRENIYMNGAILGMSRKEVDRKMESIIDFSECRQFIDTPVKRYSSGMYVKLAFAVASHLDSEIMVMDEVLAVGDMNFQKKCLGKMGDAAENENKTILYVSHNMATIRSLCSRCVVLNKGKIVFDGDVESAIAIYMEMSEEKMRCVYDLVAVQRNTVGYASKVKILSLKFLNKELPVYTPEEIMQLELKVQGMEVLENLRVRIEVKYADGSIVGMAESRPFASFKEGDIKNFILELDMKNLAEGKYYYRLSLFTLNAMGIHVAFDDVPIKIPFKIVDTVQDRTVWLRQYWGSVRLNEIKIWE